MSILGKSMGKFYNIPANYERILRQNATVRCVKLIRSDANGGLQKRTLSTSSQRLGNADEISIEQADQAGEVDSTQLVKAIDPRKDRSKTIPVELSLKYLESEAYKKTYGDNLIWKLYRRNHKLQFPPRLTRLNCVKDGVLVTGNPCPICRDEYLVVDFRNLKLLSQFISPQTEEILSAYHTSVCQFQHFKIRVAIEKARDFGLLTFTVPHRVYDYGEYYPKLAKQN